MPKMVYEDGDPVGRLEISAKDREHIASKAARTALHAAIKVTLGLATLIFIGRIFLPDERGWPLWVQIPLIFAVAFCVFFTWKRNSLIAERQRTYDADNALAREGAPDGRTVPPRLVDERPEG